MALKGVGSGYQGLQSIFVSLPVTRRAADPSQTTALAASEEVETDAAVLAAGETEVGAYFRDVYKAPRGLLTHLPLTVPYRSLNGSARNGVPERSER